MEKILKGASVFIVFILLNSCSLEQLVAFSSAISSASSQLNNVDYNAQTFSTTDAGVKSTTSQPQKKTCTFCNGTGVSPIATSVASYGSTATHWCDVCKKEVSASHGTHLKCPSCGGKGYKTSY